VILPTIEAQSQGMDAATENLAIFQDRWSGRAFQASRSRARNDEESWWTTEQVV
jgi:hypothetical protein